MCWTRVAFGSLMLATRPSRNAARRPWDNNQDEVGVSEETSSGVGLITLTSR